MKPGGQAPALDATGQSGGLVRPIVPAEEKAVVLLGASGGPDDAGLLRCGRLILDRDPLFRADYSWTAGQSKVASCAAGLQL